MRSAGLAGPLAAAALLASSGPVAALDASLGPPAPAGSREPTAAPAVRSTHLSVATQVRGRRVTVFVDAGGARGRIVLRYRVAGRSVQHGDAGPRAKFRFRVPPGTLVLAVFFRPARGWTTPAPVRIVVHVL